MDGWTIFVPFSPLDGGLLGPASGTKRTNCWDMCIKRIRFVSIEMEMGRMLKVQNVCQESMEVTIIIKNERNIYY
jgi:hypothetical protein